MTLYRIRLTGDRPYAQYVDVEANDEWHATRVALNRFRNHTSAKCMGTTEECTGAGGPTFGDQARYARVISGTGNAAERRELDALCRGLREMP